MGKGVNMKKKDESKEELNYVNDVFETSDSEKNIDDILLSIFIKVCPTMNNDSFDIVMDNVELIESIEG